MFSTVFYKVVIHLCHSMHTSAQNFENFCQGLAAAVLTGDAQDEERVPLGTINVAGGQDGGERNTEAVVARHMSSTAAAAAAAAAEERAAAASNDAARHRPAHGAGAAERDEGIRDDVQEEAEAVEAVQVAAVQAAKRRDAHVHRALRVWAEQAGVWLLRLHPQPGQSVLPS